MFARKSKYTTRNCRCSICSTLKGSKLPANIQMMARMMTARCQRAINQQVWVIKYRLIRLMWHRQMIETSTNSRMRSCWKYKMLNLPRASCNKFPKQWWVASSRSISMSSITNLSKRSPMSYWTPMRIFSMREVGKKQRSRSKSDLCLLGFLIRQHTASQITSVAVLKTGRNSGAPGRIIMGLAI